MDDSPSIVNPNEHYVGYRMLETNPKRSERSYLLSGEFCCYFFNTARTAIAIHPHARSKKKVPIAMYIHGGLSGFAFVRLLNVPPAQSAKNTAPTRKKTIFAIRTSRPPCWRFSLCISVLWHTQIASFAAAEIPQSIQRATEVARPAKLLARDLAKEQSATSVVVGADVHPW